MSADRPFDDLRRRRPDRRHSRPRSRVRAALPARDRARAADAPSSRRARPRARGLSAGASAAAAARPLPGRLLLRLDAARARAAWRRGSSAARCSCRPPTARPPPAAMIAAMPRARRRSRSCTTAPARTWRWGVATALLDAGPRAGPGRAVRGRRGLAAHGGRRRSSRALLLLSNLFRDQLDRYGELELLADRWAELVARARRARAALRAERRRPAGGRPRPRARGRRLLRRGGRLPGAARSSQHAADSKHCRNCGARLRLRGRLPRPPRPLPLPELRARAARARRSSADRVELRRDDAARDVDPAHARRARSTCASPSPASTTSTTPSRPRPRRSSWASRWTTSARRSRASAARSGASRRSRWTAAPVLDPAGQEPRRRQRGAAHADARGRRSSTSGWR